MPVKLEAPTFDAASGEVAIETLEVMAAPVSVEYPSPAAGAPAGAGAA